MIERAVILSDGETFATDEGWLKRELRARKRTSTLHGTLVEQEKEMIEAALAASEGRISGPAATNAPIKRRFLDSSLSCPTGLMGGDLSSSGSWVDESLCRRCDWIVIHW